MRDAFASRYKIADFRHVLMLAGAICGVSIAPVHADAADSTPEEKAAVYGKWVSPMEDAVISLEPCGERLCGRVVEQEFAPSVKHDVQNPDPTQRARPIIGLRILNGLKMNGRDRWKGGVFYDPRTGKSYIPKIKLLSSDRVKISGCIGPGLCKGYVWRRHNEANTSLASARAHGRQATGRIR